MSKENTTTQQIFPRELMDANRKAFDSFDFYKKTIDLMDRANIAMGKKTLYTSTISSTLNYKIGINGFSSTQKI